MALYSALLHMESSVLVLSAHPPVRRVLSSMGQLTQSAPLWAHGAEKYPIVWVINLIEELSSACIPSYWVHISIYSWFRMLDYTYIFFVINTPLTSLTCHVFIRWLGLEGIYLLPLYFSGWGLFYSEADTILFNVIHSTPMPPTGQGSTTWEDEL